jgi:3-hydroxyacyl-CoA dehydrogenase/enoyl-CoA hydratase/3-hydroxybutyryl-CoA epimerase
MTTVSDTKDSSTVRVSYVDGIAWVTFDAAGEKVNKLSRATLAALSDVVAELETRASESTTTSSGVTGVVFESAKEGMFIAGADVNEIRSIASPEAASEAVTLGQSVMNRIEELPLPTVAAIGGVCLGGGTELALSCNGRVGSDHPRFQIGLPEVNLGIVPAWGGSTRLPRLVGLTQALEVILKGRPLDARRALRIGLIDRAVSHAELRRRAEELVREIAAGKGPSSKTGRRRKRSFASFLLDGNPLGRRLVLWQARKRVLSQTKGNYPAPLLALDILRRGARSKQRSFELELEASSELLKSDVAKNLVHLFFLNEAAKKDTGVNGDEQPHLDLAVRSPESSGLLGAGTMGGGIARILASRDLSVRLKDISPEALGAGLAAARKIFEERRRRRRLTSWEVEKKMALITPTLDWSGFGGVDVVIEAIVEDMEIKKGVFRELESVVRPDCLVGSNTSTLSISEMQSAFERPGRMAGLHFFNPVHRMPLVEVIRGRETNDETVAAFVALAKRLGKTPVVVNDGPGFLVNRILGPYLNEAAFLLLETGDIAGIDRVFTDFGLPMGPLRLLDEVGLDVAQKAGRVLSQAFGERATEAEALSAMVSSGRLGKKSGRGFYDYRGKKERPDPEVPELLRASRANVSAEHALDRALGLMVAEAARCLDEGIVRSAGQLDLAMVMGIGFPPFRGGLCRWADAHGLPRIVSSLQALRARIGPRFEPPESLSRRAARGLGFYE